MTEENKDIKRDANSEMGFLDHLEELRLRIIRALVSVIGFALAAFFVSDFFIELLLLPTRGLEDVMTVQVLKVQGMLFLKFHVAFLMGIVLSIPVIAYQFWAFVAPGLYSHEKRWGPALVISVTLFFLIGAGFAAFVIVPFALKFLVTLGDVAIQKNISIDYYTKFVLQLIMASGMVFQMPVLSFMLTKMGLINHRFLRKYWRFAVIISLVIAAFITPPDPVSMLMMGIPLLFLYEVSIYIAKIAEPKDEDAGGEHE